MTKNLTWEYCKKKTVREPILEKRISDLYELYAAKIADILGITKIPPFEIKILKIAPSPAALVGYTIFINRKYFSGRNDDGVIIHEFAHAIMAPFFYKHDTFWVAEGIADYVRDKLGFQTSWSKEHYERGKALAGYQTSAHFLMYLERLYPTIIKELCRLIIYPKIRTCRSPVDFIRYFLELPGYDEKIFKKLFGKSLVELVEQYEKEQEGGA